MMQARGWTLEAAALTALATWSVSTSLAGGICPYHGSAQIMVMQNYARMTYSVPVVHPQFANTMPSFPHTATSRSTSHTSVTPSHSTAFHTTAIHQEYVNQNRTPAQITHDATARRTREVVSTASSHLQTITRRTSEQFSVERLQRDTFSHNYSTQRLDVSSRNTSAEHHMVLTNGLGVGHPLVLRFTEGAHLSESRWTGTYHSPVFKYEDKQTYTTARQRTQTTNNESHQSTRHETDTTQVAHHETASKTESHSHKLLLTMNRTSESRHVTPTIKHTETVEHTKPAPQPEAKSKPPVKPEAPKTVTKTEVAKSVHGKFTFTCGNCHFSVSKTSQTSHLNTTQPAKKHESEPSRLVKTSTASTVPVVIREKQESAPYPLETHKQRLSTSILPKVVHESRTVVRDPKKSLPATIETAPVQPRTKVPETVTRIVHSGQKRDETHRSRVSEVMLAPQVPTMTIPRQSTVTPQMSTYQQLTTAQSDWGEPSYRWDSAVVMASGPTFDWTGSIRLTPDAIMDMPTLPSGLPVLPPATTDAPVYNSGQVTLIQSVLQPPPIPSESD
jgi:hypothetical protein